MYLARRAWAELRNEVFVLPSRAAVLVWAGRRQNSLTGLTG